MSLLRRTVDRLCLALFVCLGLLACAEVSEPCGVAESVIVDGVQYCFATGTIVIETGFSCPADGSSRFEGPAGVICAPAEIELEDLPKELCDKAGEGDCSDLKLVVQSERVGFMYRRQPDGLAGPEAVEDLESLLANTASIVEGTVVSADFDPDMDYAYTQYRVEDLVVYRGAIQPGPQPDWMIVQQFGGRKPDGSRSSVTGTASFSFGKRYLFFLRNRTWLYHPMVTLPAIEGIPAVFRVEQEDDVELVIGTAERALGDVTEEGFAYASAPLYETSNDVTNWPNIPAPTRTAVPVPNGAISVDDLVAKIDASGYPIAGEFYSEPSALWCEQVFEAEQSVWCREARE